MSSVNDMISSTSHNVCDTVIEMPAGSFDIILLINNNETGGVSEKNEPIVAQLNNYPELKYEYRSLKVGDFIWIARHKVNKDQELVMRYVVERKTIDDLYACAKDVLFYEEKFRLLKCGIKNVVYMIENFDSIEHLGLPVQGLMLHALNNIREYGFKILPSDSSTTSAETLAMVTSRLTNRNMDKHLKGCSDNKDDYLMTFDYFNKPEALTVTETFIRLLLQINGVSVEKALAITAKYTTPRSLVIAYQKCDQVKGEKLLENLRYGKRNCTVGTAISKVVFQMFTGIHSD